VIILKKAQVATQIFVYIVALVVVGMVIVFGYKAVKNFGERGDEVALIKFKTDVENTFKSVSADFNRIKITEFNTPSGFDEVCLVDINTQPPLTRADFAYNELLFDGVQEGKNLFLVKGIDMESYFVGPLKVDSDGLPPGQGTSFDPQQPFGGDGKETTADSGYLLCTDIKNSKVSLKLKGKGDSVFVSLT
jgi:hypothetical protein